jgi:hypothetical protein
MQENMARQAAGEKKTIAWPIFFWRWTTRKIADNHFTDRFSTVQQLLHPKI